MGRLYSVGVIHVVVVGVSYRVTCFYLVVVRDSDFWDFLDLFPLSE